MACVPASESPSTPHLLVIPFLEQGHLKPLLQFATKLASQGLTITFVISEHVHARNLPKMKRIGESLPNLRLVPLPDGLPEECSRASFLNALEATNNMRHGVELLMEKLLLHHHQQQQPTPITFMLADVFATWSQHLATKFGLPRLVFFTSNSVSCSVFYHTSSLLSQGILPFRDENSDEYIVKDQVTCIPGIPSLDPVDFPVFMTFPASQPGFQFGLQTSESLRAASGIVINTFEELESNAIAALRKYVPVYAVGPVPLLCEKVDSATSAVNYWQEDEECLRWLDTREDSTVLYVSFGSIHTVPLSRMKELALGLEASEQPFLWVIRKDTVDGTLSDTLPEGFSSRINDRGFIISWAPQSAVLGHRAVGGFLSHCGWNSILENLSAGGVPMICMPMGGEQRLNCRLIVDEWKLGVELSGLQVGRQEVEKAVRVTMERGKEEGEERRRRGAEIRDRGVKAVEEGGSSLKNVEALIKALCSV